MDKLLKPEEKKVVDQLRASLTVAGFDVSNLDDEALLERAVKVCQDVFEAIDKILEGLGGVFLALGKIVYGVPRKSLGKGEKKDTLM